MAETVSSAQLNDLLIAIGRSLLQYVCESWPWSASGSEGIGLTLDRLAAEQRQDVGILVRLLASRGEIVDFGTYPTEYTSLHYVAVDYLLDKLVQNQEVIVRAGDHLAKASESDPEFAELLRRIASNQHRRLDELRQLAACG
ncbi:MAG: hypothetical protein AB7U20_16520 [Planctomycetaceae bacterium]